MSLTFRRLGQRDLVFDEARQAIYEVNEFAAHVWRSLSFGMNATQITLELIDSGLTRDQAEKSVNAALVALGTLVISPAGAAPLSGAVNCLSRLMILIADVTVELHLSAALVDDVREVFGPLIVNAQKPSCLLSARIIAGDVKFTSPGQHHWFCERSQFVPLLKAQLIEFVIRFASYEVALHAAALAKEDNAMLLVGSPGAGKTTLAIALAKAGFEVLADDVSLLNAEGAIAGISLPFSAKASSWPLLSGLWPGTTDFPTHCRPDGEMLCYVPYDRMANPRPRRIGVLILLDRQAQTETRVDDLDLVDALTALMAEGVTRDQRLHSSSFAALVDSLQTARCYRLIYSDLREGARAVIGLHL